MTFQWPKFGTQLYVSYAPNMLFTGGLEAKNRLGWHLKDCPTPSIPAQGSPAPPMAIRAGGWEKKTGCGRCNLPHSVDVFRVRRCVHGKVGRQWVAWAEGKVARLEHAGGIFSDDRLSRDMKGIGSWHRISNAPKVGSRWDRH